MATPTVEKMSLMLRACLAVALVAAALLFSIFFDWHSAQIEVNSNNLQLSTELCCEERDRERETSNLDELTPLDANDEEFFNTDNILAPAEVLGLDEGLGQLDNVSRRAAPVAKEEIHASHSPTALPTIEHLKPTRSDDIKKRPYIRFHWGAVSGAKEYHVTAWQFSDGKKETILDARTKDTEAQVEPRNEGTLYWAVAAIDSMGQQGETAGPLTIDLMKKRIPAQSRPK